MHLKDFSLVSPVIPGGEILKAIEVAIPPETLRKRSPCVAPIHAIAKRGGEANRTQVDVIKPALFSRLYTWASIDAPVMTDIFLMSLYLQTRSVLGEMRYGSNRQGGSLATNAGAITDE